MSTPQHSSEIPAEAFADAMRALGDDDTDKDWIIGHLALAGEPHAVLYTRYAPLRDTLKGLSEALCTAGAASPREAS